VIHPIINNYNELLPEKKNSLETVVNKIKEYILNPKIYLFGSNIKGNWNENSDYDIIVISQPSEEIKNILKNYNYGFKVDLFFWKKDDDTFKKIDITNKK
jgi:predicted nucleotidyltransferase